MGDPVKPLAVAVCVVLRRTVVGAEALLHRALDLLRTYMSRIEMGAANPTLTMIHALATSLGVPVTALFETGVVDLAPLAARRGGSRGRAR